MQGSRSPSTSSSEETLTTLTRIRLQLSGAVAEGILGEGSSHSELPTCPPNVVPVINLYHRLEICW
jgi:hypothetical protein